MPVQHAALPVKPTGILRLLLVSGTALAVLAGCERKPASAQETTPAALSVRTAPAVLATTMRFEPVSGTVRSLDHAQVSARITGRVINADFTLGQAVAAGDTLVVLSAGELDARVAQARAALDQASNDYQREHSLLAKGVSTPETVRALDEKRRMAAAAFDEASALLGYTRVTAPFAGVVTNRFVSAGDLASPGTRLFEIEGTKRLRAEVEVPESLAALPPNAPLTILVGDKRVTGGLAEFSSAADPLARTRLAKVSLPEGSGVHQGQFVRVLWPAGDTPLLTVPANAVGSFGQTERVFVAADGKAVLRLVRTGLHDNDRIQILSGLDAGETVIIDAPATLRDGQPVQTQP